MSNMYTERMSGKEYKAWKKKRSEALMDIAFGDLIRFVWLGKEFFNGTIHTHRGEASMTCEEFFSLPTGWWRRPHVVVSEDDQFVSLGFHEAETGSVYAKVLHSEHGTLFISLGMLTPEKVAQDHA